MTFRKRTFREIIPAIALVAMLQGTLFAQLNGHNLRGDYGLQSGSQAAPGWYGSLLYLNYNIDTVRDRNGDVYPPRVGTSMCRRVHRFLCV